LQAALERVTRFAEEHVAKVGSPEFPIVKKSMTTKDTKVHEGNPDE